MVLIKITFRKKPSKSDKDCPVIVVLFVAYMFFDNAS